MSGETLMGPFGGTPPRWSREGRPVGTMVVLPGAGYGPASPLLEYARQVGLAAGWTVQQVFWEVPADLTDATSWVRDQAVSAVTAEADGVPVLVVAKSLGTRAAEYAAERSLPAIWLTPLLVVPELVAGIRANPARQLLIGGTDDDLWDADVAASLATDGCDVLQVDGADHSMTVDGDPVRSAEILVEVTRAMARFVAG